MNYDPKELENGTRIEHEHTQDDALARKLAADHLREDPRYYSKLKAAGLEEDGDMEEGALTPQEAGMGECAPCGCGDPTDDHAGEAQSVAPVAVAKVAAVVAPAQGQSPLTSSGLGKNGVAKPLQSDKLEAPESKNVGANKIASTKTPPLGGSTLTTDSADPLDHFGSAIVSLAEGGSAIKKK